MKKIPLTQGLFAKIDDSDYVFLNKFKWKAAKHGKKLYAARNTSRTLNNGKQTSLHMHTVIMGTPKGMETDHIDNDGLNNQRKNLRICTRAQNQRNKGIYKSNTSGFKGVSWHTCKKMWRAIIKVNNKQIHLGEFSNKEDAYKAYCDACIKYHGAFSKLK